MENSEFRKDEAIRKLLLFVLRHGAKRLDLAIDAEGYVDVNEMLQERSFKYMRGGGCSLQQIQRVVENNSCKQFTLKCLDTGEWMIRANFGHTLVQVDKLDLGQHVAAGEYESIVHAGYERPFNFNKIKIEGLKRERNHIIFNSIERIDNEFLERFDFLIYIDINRAIEDGIKFFKSEKNMILTNSDFIDPKYFLKIVDCKSGNNIDLQK